MEMYMWCVEALSLGIIESFEHQPSQFVLSEPRKYKAEKGPKSKERELVKGHVYTADFRIETSAELPFKKRIQNIGTVYIDVKGSFNRFGGSREFSINQKWVLKDHGTYIHKVIPEEFFSFTFVPRDAMLTKKTKVIKRKYLGCRSAEEYLKTLEG